MSLELLQNSLAEQEMMTQLNEQRSPLTLSRLEIGAAVLAGIVTWLFYNAVFWTFKPFSDCCGFYDRRQVFFLGSAPLFVAIVAVSAIFVVRMIKGDTYHFTGMGYFALACPGLLYVPMTILFFIGLPFLIPFSVILILVTLFGAIKRRNRWGDLLVFPVHIATILLFLQLADRLWSIYGD